MFGDQFIEHSRGGRFKWHGYLKEIQQILKEKILENQIIV